MEREYFLDMSYTPGTMFGDLYPIFKTYMCYYIKVYLIH